MLKNPCLNREKIKGYLFSLPSRKSIINYLIKRKKPTSCIELAHKLNIREKNQFKGLCRRLRAMERDGQLIFTKHQCYFLPASLNLLCGTIIGHHHGFGFLHVEDKQDDYYLSVEQMKIAIHGDIVIAKPKGVNHRGRCEARIIRILVPKTKQIFGRFFINANSAFVIPDDSRFSFKILIPPNEAQGAQMGCMVVVEIIKRPTKYKQAIGKVIKVLDNNMSISMMMDIALRTYNIPVIWPANVEQQLSELQDAVPEQAKLGRIDLRSLPLITIDDDNAHDFDDAIYCEKKSSGGWRLLVAIADVSYYVRPHTLLDQEAFKRATSVYFPFQVIPMLPEVLSNNLCSLNPQVDRLCMVCEMIISDQGQLSSYKFYEAIMNSCARLTYNTVYHILHGQQDLCAQYIHLMDLLTQLHSMSKTLEQARVKRGGIYFEIEETKFIFNKEHRIKYIEPIKRNDAHKLIEECMIIANIAAANFVEKHREPALYRVHDRPSVENITSLRILLRELGLKLGGGNKPESKDYADMIHHISSRSDQDIIQNVLLRSMKQAIYDPDNRGHFGLALKAYVHFTSPIRRYSDLTLHRIIKYLINQQKGRKKDSINNDFMTTGGQHFNFEELVKLGQQCSMSERRADNAMRDVTNWLKCDFMKHHIGKVFKGVITKVFSFGFFVRLNKLLISGLVNVASLDDDHYYYNSLNQQLIGQTSGRIYQLGNVVKIRVEDVRIYERKIDFTLISSYT